MKPNKFVVASIFAASITALGAGTAYASPSEGWDHPYMMTGAHSMRGNDMGAIPPQFHRLKLTQAQRNQIFDIKYKSMPVLRQYRLELRNTRRAMREAIVGKQYDATKIRSLADKMGQLQADIAIQRASDQHAIFAVLTPEQQIHFKKLRHWHPGHRQSSARGMDA